MAKNSTTSMNMRIIHRYLGFFLVGIMTVYSISGLVLIFRDTDFLKRESTFVKTVKAQASAHELGPLLGIRNLQVAEETPTLLLFKDGQYDKATGVATYTEKHLPYVLDKMTKLHKAKSAEPLFFLNIFFGLSLLFFVISSFWMFMPKTDVFKKGLYFTLAGIVLTLLLLFL